MPLCNQSDDVEGILFFQLRNVLDPGTAVALSSVSKDLRRATRVSLQQLKTDHKAAAAFCLKLGRSCKALREATFVAVENRGVTTDDLKLLGALGSVLPALEMLCLYKLAAGPDGVRQLAEGLCAGALQAVTWLRISFTHVGDAGASAFAAALGQGALPRLKTLWLDNAAIGDAGLVALAPAFRQLAALEGLTLDRNPLGDEGLAALVAPPPPAGAPLPTTGGLAKLCYLHLRFTEITNAGCATLAAALKSGTLPALDDLELDGIRAGYAAKEEARAYLKEEDSEPDHVILHEETGSEEESEEEDEGEDDAGEEESEEEDEGEDDAGEEEGEGL